MLTKTDSVLEVKDLVKQYKGAATPSLNGLSFSVLHGEIFGLLGPNGAGKTTAISIISTLIKPSKGHITLCGFDVSKLPGKVRTQIGFVPQDIALYSELTGRENLRYYGKLYGLSGKKLENEIDKHVDLFGLRKNINQRVSKCSGGIKRRINIIAGILHNPKLLLLDEPSVGIDAQSRHLIMETLLFLKDTGTSMIYTTHYMEEAETLCSNVAIIDEGKTIAKGAPKELINESKESNTLGDLFLQLTGKFLRE